ncbi:hypothetical protein RchiOBHm_Chr2g0102111 [Rosa chinensis]|uniref:Uncharacterized protein n=1 Tax=Rosa chinensis TaxID=74649 RepID=A0A2P6RMJ3_ROSCH|nr:hypothetical protein RchiOBHm_Chr2g0102111 [Rosa chinensis]
MCLVTKFGSIFFQKLLWLPSKSKSRLNPAFRSQKSGLHCSAGDCRLMKVLKYRSLPFLVEAITRYPYASSNLSPSSQTQ